MSLIVFADNFSWPLLADYNHAVHTHFVVGTAAIEQLVNTIGTHGNVGNGVNGAEYRLLIPVTFTDPTGVNVLCKSLVGGWVPGGDSLAVFHHDYASDPNVIAGSLMKCRMRSKYANIGRGSVFLTDAFDLIVVPPHVPTALLFFQSGNPGVGVNVQDLSADYPERKQTLYLYNPGGTASPSGITFIGVDSWDYAHAGNPPEFVTTSTTEVVRVELFRSGTAGGMFGSWMRAS